MIQTDSNLNRLRSKYTCYMMLLIFQQYDPKLSTWDQHTSITLIYVPGEFWIIRLKKMGSRLLIKDGDVITR